MISLISSLTKAQFKLYGETILLKHHKDLHFQSNHGQVQKSRFISQKDLSTSLRNQQQRNQRGPNHRHLQSGEGSLLQVIYHHHTVAPSFAQAAGKA